MDTPPAADPTAPVEPSTSIGELVVDPSDPPARLSDVITVPLDAETVAKQLSLSTLTAQDESATPDARAAAGVVQQLALRWLAERPDLDNEVLRLLDPLVRVPLERTIEARQFASAVRAGTSTPAPPVDDLPAWTIIAPEPVATLLDYYSEAEAATGVPWYWLAAIHLQETRLGRIDGVSSAGAVGPMQFLPSTWAQCCSGDPTIARDAVLGAATYLALSGAPQDMRAALYQYNPNVSYVVAVTATAENLRERPALFFGYYGWQVFFATSAGDVRLPLGYEQAAPIDAADFVRTNPQHLAD